jgi:hypothetical protein
MKRESIVVLMFSILCAALTITGCGGGGGPVTEPVTDEASDPATPPADGIIPPAEGDSGAL